MSPSILLLAMTPSLPDPALFLILQALKQERLWLLQATAEQQSTFLAIASQNQKKPAQTRGPTEALVGYLSQLEWTISDTGDIGVADFCQLNLLRHPFQQFVFWARRKWETSAITKFTKRYSVYGLPPPDVTLTQQVLRKHTLSEK